MNSNNNKICGGCEDTVFWDVMPTDWKNLLPPSGQYKSKLHRRERTDIGMEAKLEL
jgi:hypothetical protein